MFFKTLTLLILGFVLWFGGLVWFIEDMPQGTPNMTFKTRAIVVLTGGNNRIAEGFRLLAQESATTHLLISGVRRGASLKAVIQGSGFKGPYNAAQVSLDYRSTTTVENAQNVAVWLKRKQIKSIRLVTANYHMRRALIEFDRSLKGVKIIPHAINPLESGGDTWCKDYKIFCLYLNEYHKYLGAFVRMKIQRLYEKDF